MSLPIQNVECALIAAAVEAMPAQMLGDKPDLGQDWIPVAHLYAKDALLIARRLGLGNVVWYGYIAKHRLLPIYVVAIRGTRLPLEWIEDATAVPIQHPTHGVGAVHQGFFNLYESMTCNGDNIVKAVVDIVGQDQGAIPLVLTIGHSLGAPLAAYLALDLASQLGERVSCAMFASPLPGDGSFAHYFDVMLGDRYSVVNYSRDLVPHCPLPGLLGSGFQPLMKVTQITPSQGAVKVADGAKCAHAATTYAALLGAKVQSSCISGVQL